MTREKPDAGAVSPWIQRFSPLIAPGDSVLDLAAGDGRHSRWFKSLGHPVTAVDRDLAGLADLGANLGTDPAVELIQADLEDGSPWPLRERRFGAVVVTHYLWRPLFDAILGAVRPNGLLLYETFAKGQEACGRPSNPDFLLRPGELLEQVRRAGGGFTVLAYEHGRIEGISGPAVKQRIAAVRGQGVFDLGTT